MRQEHASVDARGQDGRLVPLSTVTLHAQYGRETCNDNSSVPTQGFQEHQCAGLAKKHNDAYSASRADAPVACSQLAQSDPGYVVNYEQEHSTCTKIDLPSREYTNEAVVAEAAKVQAKFMASVDTATEVVVRFDFMTEHDSRVSVYAVVTADAAVLELAATDS